MPLTPVDPDRHLGDVLVKLGLVRPEELARAIADLARREAAGEKSRLGGILIELGAVTAEGLREALEAEGENLLQCPACGRFYHVSDPTPGAKTACPGCGGSLRIQGAAETIAVTPSAADPAPSRPDQQAPTHFGEPSTPDPAYASPPTGAPFGRYRLLASLGEGGMGMVWKAWDTDLRRVVALKQIRAEKTGGDEAVNRFLREARVAAKLRNPNIVGVYDVGIADGQHFITMEYIEGRTFGAYLAETGDAKRAGGKQGMDRLRNEIRLLADVAGAVAYAHAESVVHRDLKPGNVLLDGQERAFVVDFGLAKEVSTQPGTDSEPPPHTLTLSGQVLGTPAYMSPEQVDGDAAAIGPRSDVWSLGAILYETLTGQLPFGGEGTFKTLYAVLQLEPPRPRGVNAHVPEELEAICLRALEKSPARRYAGAREFAEELQRWLRGEPVLATRQTFGYRLWRRLARRRAIAVPAAAAFLALVTALGWAWREHDRAQARTTAMLERIVPQVTNFEDRVMRKAMDGETRAFLAEQPLSVLNQLIVDDPDFAPAFAWRARVRRLLRQNEEASADFARAAALAPDDPAVRLLRGLDRIERYGRSRGLPTPHIGSHGLEFIPARDETAEEREWRSAGLEDLDRAGDVSWDETEARVARVLAAMHRGRAEEVERALAALEGLDHPKAWKVRGLILYHLRRFEDAVAALTHATQAWPRDTAALCALGDARLAQGLSLHAQGGDAAALFAQTEADFAAALAVEPSEHRARFSRGCAAMWRAESQAAHGIDPRETLLRARADFAPDLAGTRPYSFLCNNRGNVELCLGRAEALRGVDPLASLTRAQAAFEEAARLGPGVFEPQLNLGAVHVAIGDRAAERGLDPRDSYRRAVLALDQAIRIDPAQATALVNRGQAFLCLGEAEALRGADARDLYAKAMTDCDAALRIDADIGEALGNRGVTLVQIGMAEHAQGLDARDTYRKAIADFDRALARVKESADYHLNRGLAWHRLGEAEQTHQQDPRPSFLSAIADDDEASRINPSLAGSYSNRGSVRLSLAEALTAADENPLETLTRALEDFALAIERNPAFAMGWCNRGMALQALGEIDEREGRDPRDRYRQAIAEFDHALGIDPAFPNGYNNRGAAWMSLGREESRRGADPAASFARAQADYLKAIELHFPNAWLNLGLLKRAQGLPEEAIEAFEAGKARLPVEAAWADQQIAQTRQASHSGSAWKLDIAQALHLFQAGDYAAARLRLTNGLAVFDHAGKAPADDQERAALAQAQYAFACIEAARAKKDLDATVAVDSAFAHLGEAMRLGYRDDLEPLEEVEDLVALHRDPRWAQVLAGRK